MEETILGKRPTFISMSSLLAGTLLTGSTLAAPAAPENCRIHWLDAQTPQRITVDPGGQAANGDSRLPFLSADGSMLAFESTADNLVPEDSGTGADIFVRDLATASTVRVSVSSEGMEANAGSSTPAVSADGRWIAFTSFASNLVPGGRFDARTRVFLHDRETQSTHHIEMPTGYENAERPVLNADGSVVAFNAHARTGAVRSTVFVYDRSSGALETVPNPDGRSAAKPRLSDDGRHVVFETVGDGRIDIHLYDRDSGAITRVSRTADGGDPDGSSTQPTLSGDGRTVSFISSASNLVADDSNGLDDVFVFDRDTGEITRASLGSDGTQANAISRHPVLSAEGRFVGFISQADNLVPEEDADDAWDVYVRDRVTGETVRLPARAPQNWGWSLSADGRYVAMTSNAPERVPGETSHTVDILLYGPLFEREGCEDGLVAVAPGEEPDVPEADAEPPLPEDESGSAAPSVGEVAPNPPPPGVSTTSLSSLLRVLQPVGPNWFTALLDR